MTIEMIDLFAAHFVHVFMWANLLSVPILFIIGWRAGA